MKLEDTLKLQSGQKIINRRYGKCIVKEVIISFGELFGVVITPSTEIGRNLLRSDSGTDIPDFLEDSASNLSFEQALQEKE